MVGYVPENARVAQRIERDSPKVGVGGSNPSAGTIPDVISQSKQVSCTDTVARSARPGMGTSPTLHDARGVHTDPEPRRRGSVMELQIRSNGTKVTDGMREFIDHRMSKLDRLADKVVDAQLELRTETPRTGLPETTAQLTLHTGKHILRAEERSDDPAKAIDAAVDKLVVQVRKFNDKKKSRRRRAGEHPMTQMVTDEETAALDIPESELPDTGNGEVDDFDEFEEELPLRVKRFSVKPMAVDEAIDQMELLGHDFFLFHNADEDQMNVVYKRRDGAYGLLSPERV